MRRPLIQVHRVSWQISTLADNNQCFSKFLSCVYRRFLDGWAPKSAMSVVACVMILVVVSSDSSQGEMAIFQKNKLMIDSFENANLIDGEVFQL